MSKEIEKALASCLETIEYGESLEHCIARYPNLAAELEPLLRTALLLQQVTHISAKAEFKVSTRRRILSSLKPGQPTVLKRRLLSWHWRWAAALSTFLVILLGWGTVAMADNSLPDQPLYNVKIATEEVKLALTLNDINKARIEMYLAQKRTHEIAEMARRNRTKGLDWANQRLAHHLNKLAIIIANQEDNHTEVRKELETLLDNQVAQQDYMLERTLRQAPDPNNPTLRIAIERSRNSYKNISKNIGIEKLNREKLRKQDPGLFKKKQDRYFDRETPSSEGETGSEPPQR